MDGGGEGWEEASRLRWSSVPSGPSSSAGISATLRVLSALSSSDKARSMMFS